MGDVTNIFWCDHTHNTHWGCLEVSEGCFRCYARVWAERMGHNSLWGPPRETERMVTGNANWRKPRVWNARASAGDHMWDEKHWRAPVRPNTDRRLVFSNSMSDVFEYNPELDLVRQRLWNLIEETPMLDWLLLTKRPMNIKRMLPKAWLAEPRPNVWLGASVETQEWADLRLKNLLDVPAVVHFISAEPLLGALDLREWLGPDKVTWVITGGESGNGHRPIDMEWVRSINEQCEDAGVAHFFKQVGGRRHDQGGCLVDGVEIKNFPTPRAPSPVSQAA